MAKATVKQVLTTEVLTSLQKQLTVGQVFKNYKELCGFLGRNTTSGNYKATTLKYFESICSYHKDGNKIIVDNIYDEPLAIENDKRCRFIDPVKDTIVNLLAKKGGQVVYGKNQLMKNVGMVNENFCLCKDDVDNKLRLIRTLDINPLSLEDYDKNSNNLTSTKIEQALNELVEEGLIMYSKTYNLAVLEKVGKKVLEYKKVGRKKVPQYNEIKEVDHHQLATDSEVRFIMDTKARILLELANGGAENLNYILAQLEALKLTDEQAYNELIISEDNPLKQASKVNQLGDEARAYYYREVNSRLMENYGEEGYVFCYEVYKIIIAEEYLNRLNELLQTYYSMKKDVVSKFIMDNLLINAQGRQNKSIDKLKTAINPKANPSLKMDCHRTTGKYMDDMNKIAHAYHNNSCPTLDNLESIKKMKDKKDTE